LEADRIVSENVKRVARLATIEGNRANAAIGRGLIKAVSRDGVGGSSCVVYEEPLEKQTAMIFAER